MTNSIPFTLPLHLGSPPYRRRMVLLARSPRRYGDDLLRLVDVFENELDYVRAAAEIESLKLCGASLPFHTFVSVNVGKDFLPGSVVEVL